MSDHMVSQMDDWMDAAEHHEPKTPAEICKARGFEPGDILRLRFHNNNTQVYQLTAIGLNQVLMRFAYLQWWAHDAESFFDPIDMEKIDKAPLDDTPPKKEWFE